MDHSDGRPGRTAIVAAALLAWAVCGPSSATAIAEQGDPSAGREVEQAPAPAAEQPAPEPPQPAPAPPQPAPPPELAPAIEAIPTEPGSWRPPARASDPKRAKDWVLLKSGELLRGDIEHIRDEVVY